MSMQLDDEHEVVTDESVNQPTPGVALCLSGGGYRAMLFHLGAIIRLNELGILRKISRVSSVSGGSITAAVLGLNWNKLGFDARGTAINLGEQLSRPILQLANTTIDRGAILGGSLLPGSISDRVVASYREHLFGTSTLQDLPDDDEGPRFVINATNVQTGALVRFSRPFLADYRVGMVRKPKVELAVAVAASSAFPPFLSPLELDVNPKDFEPDALCELQRTPYNDTMILTDGGVYDNLGLETAWKRYQTILVSDGGGKMQPEPEPDGDWARHSKRILDIVDNQVRSLRKRQLIDSLKAEVRRGAYWGIRSDISKFDLADAMEGPLSKTMALAETPTRLMKLPSELQQRIVNWGYAVSDASVRRHASELIVSGSRSPAFPFAVGIG